MINEIREPYTTQSVFEYTKLYSTLNLLREGSNIVKVGNCNDIGLDAILRGVSSKKGFKYQSLQSGSEKAIDHASQLKSNKRSTGNSQTDQLQSGGENITEEILFKKESVGSSDISKTLPIDLLYLYMPEPDFISQGFKYMERVRPAGFAVIGNLDEVRMALACYANKQNHGAINPVWKVVEDGRMGNSVILKRL